MSNFKTNKQLVSDLIREVWHHGNLDLLSDFWSEDCINHAMPAANNRGLEALHSYHESLSVTLTEAFTDFQTEILQQIAEGETVVTQMRSSGKHQGTFLGIPATSKNITLSAMRIDRLQDGKIIEHWSIADMAGLMQQLQA
jgi:steroid delta-isomerase-like uncharacterized protein